MKATHLRLLLEIAALTHVGLICAGATMPVVVDVRRHLRALPIFIQQLFWVYYAFIGFCLLGFGVLTGIFAQSLAEGGPLARGFCAFLMVFWISRLLVAAFVFDLRTYLPTPLHRVGYVATNIVFLYLPFVYGCAALKGGVP